MKKQVIIAALLFTAASSFAQIAAGTKYVGGILNFNTTTESSTLGSTTTKSPSSSSFTGSPEFGYFVADNLAVGVSLDLTSRTTTNYKADGSENAKTVSGGTGVTLYGRKFFNINENLSLFGGLNVGYTGGVTKTTAASTTTENSNFSTFGASVDAGVAFNLSPKVTIVGKWAALGFNSTTTTQPNFGGTSNNLVNKEESFGLGINTLGNPFGVGIYFAF